MGCWIRHLLRNTVFKVFPPQTLFVDRVQHRDPGPLYPGSHLSLLFAPPPLLRSHLATSLLSGLVGPKLPKPDQPPFSCSVAQLLPIVNLEGRRGVDTGSFCIRKKLNGVDLNRNYPIAFQKLVRKCWEA